MLSQRFLKSIFLFKIFCFFFFTWWVISTIVFQIADSFCCIIQSAVDSLCMFYFLYCILQLSLGLLVFFISLMNFSICSSILLLSSRSILKLFFTFKFIDFILAVPGLHCSVRAFSICGIWGLLSSSGMHASHCSGFFCCRTGALGHVDFNSCGSWS